jgi:hypothetical protein
MTREFCTYFDARYLTRGLALLASLRRHCPGHRLWVLCLDDECHAALQRLRLPSVQLIRQHDFERGDEPLQAARRDRSLVEYYFTCTPSLPRFVLQADPSVSMVTYLDADLFFFASPEPLFEEIGDRSIAIVPHRFPPAMRHWQAYGIYNVGWLTFRRSPAALTCLEWWREQCLAWCGDRADGVRFADQKYLDDWPSRFDGVHVIAHKGANLASWNLANHHVSGPAPVCVDEAPLIFFHFHHLRRRREWLIETDLDVHRARLNDTLKRHVYGPYLRALDEAAAFAREAGVPAPAEALRASAGAQGQPWLTTARQAAAGKWLLYVNGRVR